MVTGPKLALARQEGVTSLRKEMVTTVGRQETLTTNGGRQEILTRGVGKRQEVVAGAGAPRQEVVTAPRQVFSNQ